MAEPGDRLGRGDRRAGDARLRGTGLVEKLALPLLRELLEAPRGFRALEELRVESLAGVAPW